MAETKLTLNQNHFLVYEDFDGDRAVDESERPLTNLDFANSLPLDGDTQVRETTKHRYYYLNLDWKRRPEYLNLEGENFGLHIINIDTNGTAYKNEFCPSVMPKKFIKVRSTDAGKPDYLTQGLCGNTNSKGLGGLANFKYDGFTIAGELKLDFKPSDKQSCFYYYDSYNKDYSPRSEILVEETAYQENDWLNDEVYYDDKIVYDMPLFPYSDNFDSNDYLGGYVNRVKFVYKPIEKDNKVIHELHCYTDDQHSEPYYFDYFTEEYVSMKNDISLVTFIPIKDKQADMPGELKWMLCEFCRGIAASTNFTEVDRNDVPARIKYEWRPLTFKNKPKQAIIFTDEEFNEFLTIYQYIPKQPQEDVSPTDSSIPVDANGNFKSIEVNSYNINPQFVEYEPGKTVQVLIDNRDDENGEENKHLKILNRNSDVYYVTVDKYYSDRNSSKYTFSENDYILLDADGYPLYSPDVLTKLGIGYLKASWVIYDNGELKAYVPYSDLITTWYNGFNKKTNYDVFGEDGKVKSGYVEGPIYSTRYLMVPDNGSYKWAEANKLTWDNGYYQDNEEIVYIYGDLMGINPEQVTSNTGASKYTNEVENIFRSRQIIYKTKYNQNLLSMAKNEDTNTWSPLEYYGGNRPAEPEYPIILTILNPESDNKFFEFITWQKEPSDSNVSYSYTVRYRISENTLSTIDKGPQYKNFAFWTVNANNEEELTTIDNYSDISPVNEIVDNETKPIIREIQYIITYTLALDNMPTNPYIGTLLPNTWSYAQTLKQAFLQGHIVSVKSVSKDSTIPQEKYLEEQIKQIKFMTPSEYYADKMQLIDDEDSSHNWFWLDTLSNWCRYELYEDGTTIMLKLWNGLGGWDDVQDILKEINLGDNNKLLKNFLYNKDFFVYGVEFPINNSQGLYIPAYNPVVPKNVGDAHIPIFNRGQIHYFTLVLPKDTRSILYKTNMSNYNEQFNYNGDYNDYARMFYPENKEGITKRKPDDTRQYAIGIASQYCPCVMKMRTDELAICIYLTAQVANELGYYKNIITPDEANIRCKKIFGDGADKTIENDWKRYFKNNRIEEKKSDVRDTNDDTIFNTQSSVLVKGSDTINTIRIYAMRPNPTTNNKDIQDYLERWDK